MLCVVCQNTADIREPPLFEYECRNPTLKRPEAWTETEVRLKTEHMNASHSCSLASMKAAFAQKGFEQVQVRRVPAAEWNLTFTWSDRKLQFELEKAARCDPTEPAFFHLSFLYGTNVNIRFCNHPVQLCSDWTSPPTVPGCPPSPLDSIKASRISTRKLNQNLLIQSQTGFLSTQFQIYKQQK